MIPSNDDFPSAQDCLYTSHYCEENVWKLCEKLKNMNYSALEDCYCVFVSNDTKLVPLWYQKAGTGEDYFVAWDYHVFLIRKNKATVDVFDFDTLLGFPSCFEDYVRKAIGSESNMIPTYHRFFRVIPAKEYLRAFASDRSHMKNEKGEWMKPPPPYEPIKTSTSTNNLSAFISMEKNEGPGRVMDLKHFVMYFTGDKLVEEPLR